MGRASLGSNGTTGTGLNFQNIISDTAIDFGKSLMGSAKRAIAWETRPSNIFAGILTQIETLKRFDWNATDEEIRAMMESQKVTAASMWGGVIGQGIGRLAGVALGGGLRITMPVLSSSEVNRVIAERMMDELLDDAADEIGSELGMALQNTLFLGINMVMVNAYLHFRSTIKALPTPALEGMVGKQNAHWIKTGWGAESAPILSFNAVMDEKVESIKSPALEAFTEELLEEAWAGFIESGFIIATSLDEAYASARLGQLATQGAPRQVALVPDENAPDETFRFLDTPQEEVIQQSTTLLNQYRTIRNRDVGTIVGQTANEAFKTMPQLRRLTIEFRSKAKPPWILSDGKNAYPHHVRIPNPKPGLTRNQILHAAKPYTFGAYSGTVHFTDRRKLIIYCSTATEARTRAEELAELSASKILKITGSQVFETDKNLKREPMPMFPTSARLMFRQNLKGTETLETVTEETVKTDYLEMTLWTDDPLPGEPTSF